jgi:protein-tyrosine phosphatase
MGWLRFLGGWGGFGPRRRRSPWNNVDDDGFLNCARVSPSLLLGGEIGPRDWEALADAGVSVVVNLQEEQQDVFAPGENLDGYLWLPAPDGRAPSVEQLEQGVAFVRGAMANGRKVFVHCKAGQGRAPLFCACCLIAEGLAPLEATKRVSAARPTTNLTAEQSRRLREFAAHLNRHQPPPTAPDPEPEPRYIPAPQDDPDLQSGPATTPFDKALPTSPSSSEAAAPNGARTKGLAHNGAAAAEANGAAGANGTASESSTPVAAHKL